MADEIQQLIALGGQSSGLLMIGIILLSYLLEDGAIVTAASLAAQGQLPTSLALIAIMVGIITGDLGLYYLGKYAQKSRWLRHKALTNRYFKSIRTRLHQGAFYHLFIIRFIPGLRTIGFTLSGFFTLPLPLFLSAVTLATALWTAIIFSVIYALGTSAWVQAATYQWVLIPVAILLMFGMSRIVNHSFSKGLL